MIPSTALLVSAEMLSMRIRNGSFQPESFGVSSSSVIFVYLAFACLCPLHLHHVFLVARTVATSKHSFARFLRGAKVSADILSTVAISASLTPSMKLTIWSSFASSSLENDFRNGEVV